MRQMGCGIAGVKPPRSVHTPPRRNSIAAVDAEGMPLIKFAVEFFVAVLCFRNDKGVTETSCEPIGYRPTYEQVKPFRGARVWVCEDWGLSAVVSNLSSEIVQCFVIRFRPDEQISACGVLSADDVVGCLLCPADALNFIFNGN